MNTTTRTLGPMTKAQHADAQGEIAVVTVGALLAALFAIATLATPLTALPALALAGTVLIRHHGVGTSAPWIAAFAVLMTVLALAPRFVS